MKRQTIEPRTRSNRMASALCQLPCIGAVVLMICLSTSNSSVSAFAPRHSSGMHRPTRLNNLLDAVGDLIGGPKLEAETNLPYDPPFCSELSCSDGVRTFAIKERP